MPQIILASAGYDGHAEDSISDTLLSSSWFATVTNMLKKFARDACDNRLLFILEGGYNPIALETSVLASLDSLLSDTIPPLGIPQSERAERLLQNHPMRAYWSL